MSRTKLLFFVFFLIGGISVFAVIRNQKETFDIGTDREFAIEQIDQITKIFIADRKGDNTTLVRKKGIWHYNGKYKANPNVIENLLDAIERIEMKFKPADAAIPGMVASLASNGLKVELYDEKNELLKAYYIGGATPDERGTYMIMEGSDQPYVCYLPGWEGNLRFRFNLRGDQWRDKTVFDLQPEEIKSIKTIYPKQKNKSFSLIQEQNNYVLYPVSNFTKIPNGTILNKETARRYLAGFSRLIAESFENNNPKKDSIRRNLPFCSIELEGQNGNIKHVNFYPIFSSMGLDPKTGELIGDGAAERFFADCDQKEFMLVQNRDI